MKIKNVSFNDDEDPQSITVEMTVDEAALVYSLSGHLSPKAVTDASGDLRWGTALYDVADCLSGSFFNRFWDAGAQEVAPRLNVRLDDAEQETPTP